MTEKCMWQSVVFTGLGIALLYGCEAWPIKMFGRNKEEATEAWR
jgi:hypothetical protein